MVEQSHLRKCHCNTVFVAAVDYYIVPYGTAGLGDKGNAASVCALYVVVKREKRVRAERYIVKLCEPSLFFFLCEGFGASVKGVLPNIIADYVLIVVGDVYINGVISVGSADGLYKVESCLLYTSDAADEL